MNQRQNTKHNTEPPINVTKKKYSTPVLIHLGEMKEITRYDVSVIVE